MNPYRRTTLRPLSASLSRFTSAAAVCAALALAASHSAKAAPAAWDVDGLVDGILTAGSGTWDNLAPNFTNLADSIPHFAWDNVVNAGDSAFFGGAGGTGPFTITVGTITTSGVTFATPGYLLTGGTLTMGGGTVETTVDGRINSVITGAGGLTKTGTGTLTLGGANTFTGQLQITAGMVSLSGLGLGPVAGGGVGNETVVASGATLNLGGQAYGNQAPGSTTAEIFQIQGTGVGGIGALINAAATQTSATSKVVLTGDATVNAGGGFTSSFNAGGAIVSSAGGRFDVRNNAAPTAGQEHLDLNGFTLTKIGQNQLALVNADVSSGNIVVNEGHLYFEAGTIALAGVNVTVNPNGKFGWWAVGTGANITHNVLVNGGTIGDITSTNASQTVNAPVTITGAQNPNFVANANTTTLAALISEDGGSTITAIEKRGGATLAFGNQANSFDAPIIIRAGSLQGNYATAFAGGVAPGAPTALTGTPLGTAGTVTLAGGTLNVRVDGANDATNQVFTIGKSLVVDNAPGGINLDRLTATGGTDKNLLISAVFAPASAANGWSIGQNLLTGAQNANRFRPQLDTVTMNSDTALSAGDFTLTGAVNSANRNSLVHIGSNSWGFTGGTTQQFNALFNLGAANLRIGSMFGTGVTNDTVTAGTGTIYNAPNAVVALRTDTNLAPGQAVELVSQRVAMSTINLENFTAVPANLRAVNSGVLGVGNAAGFGDINLNKLGDGTFRIGAAYAGTGNGTVSGVVAAGAGNVVRIGAGAATGSTVTFTATDAISGTASLEVGSDLVNGGFRTNATGAAQNGTAILTGANAYTGGTTVNRSSTLRFEVGTPGTGAVSVFGSMAATGATGTFIDGAANLPVTLNGASTLQFDNAPLTTAADVDRWLDTAQLALRAGTLRIDARNNNSTTNETIGELTFAGGSFLNLQRNNIGASQITQLQASTFTRVGQGTLEMTRAGNSGFGGTIKILATGTPPTVTNGMIAPYFIINDPTRFQNFATYDVTNGVMNATYTGTITTGAPAGTFTPGLLSTGYYYADFAASNTTLTLGDNPVLYALKVGGGTSSTTLAITGGNTTITLRSGGLIFSADNTAGGFSTDGTRTVNFNPHLTANDGASNIEAAINVRNAFTANMNGQITAAGLTKSGAGTLNIFASQAALTGTKSINQGILQIFGPTATGTHNSGGTGMIELNGGQLNLRSNNSAVTGTINATLQTGLTVAENIPLAVIDSNRSVPDTASVGTFIFNPATAGSPGLRLLGSPGAQGQTLTISGASYAVQFGANAINSFAGNVTINNAITTTLDNSPSITGTAPVLTKSGAGTLIVGRVATPTGTTVSPNTTVAVNAGTLELRSLFAVGSGGAGNTSIAMNAGTLNLRRDSAGTYGGFAATGYDVTVNGTSTISIDRFSAGSNFAMGLGKLTTNTNGTLTINNGNGVYVTLSGGDFKGTAFIASNVAAGSQESSALFRGGFDVSGGALVKSGSGHLHLLNADSSYDGGTYVQQGTLRLRAFNAVGKGNVYVNPGATLDFNSDFNLNGTQQVFVRGNGAHLPMLSVNVDTVSHPTLNVDTSAAPVGIVGLSNGPGGFYNNVIDLSALYGGDWSLGGVSAGAYDPRYTAPVLLVGNGNLYRLGGGGTSMAIGHDSAGIAYTNLLTGPNDVRLGFDSGNIRVNNATNFQYAIAGNNDYTGGNTVIHRGMVARIFEAPDTVNDRTALSNSAVDVFGVLSLSGSASMVNGLNTGNINTITLHPGSALFLDNQNGGVGSAPAFTPANITDRLQDATPIALNGAMLNLIGSTDTVSSEVVGDVTFSRGARLRAQRSGTTGTATLTLNSLTSAGPGSTLTLAVGAAGQLGGVDQIIVATGAPTPVNGMVSPSIVNLSDNTFVTYGGAGFANVIYDDTVNGTYPAGSLTPTDKVDVITADLTLQDNPTIYALRSSRTINVGAFNTMTVRSGGFIGTGTITINPHLVFNDGTSNIEARMYVSGTTTINSPLTANGVTKFGAGNMVLNVPNPAYASGWTVNSGTLQVNDAEGLGQSVPGNAVTLNGSLTTGGQAAQNFGTQTILNFNRNNGTPEVYTFTGGPITVVNEATIRIGAGGDDRVLQIPPVIVDSTSTESSVSLTIDVPNNRHRGIIPSLTLNDDATVRVYDLGNQVDTGRITAAVVNSLVGTGKDLVKLGNRTLELPNNNSATFTGGSITVSQGTIRVRNNGSLGSATTATTIERNAALEIDTPNFTPTGTLNQIAGSIERWNREDARLSGYTLPTGVNLQLNANLIAPRVIGIDGGTIEGFLYTDHVAPAAERLIGPNVTVVLVNDSYVGQNILQGQGYDAGRLPTVGQPFGDNITGAFLRIEGAITGANDLTKTGLDTVTIANPGNSYGNTTVEMGTLRIGVDNALPIGGVLSTRTGGIFDLFGNNQLVAGLGTPDASPNPGGVGVGSAGRVINSGVNDNTLNVTTAVDYTYNGSLGLNVALTKTGSGTLTLAGNNTHRGLTTVTAGTLQLNATGFNAIEGNQVPDKVPDILVNGGTLRLIASNQIGDLITVNVTSGLLDINSKTETFRDLTVSGGAFVTGIGGVTTIPDPTLTGGTTTLNADSYNTWGALNISGGTNTVQGKDGPAPGSAGAMLIVGAAGGLNFSGTASPNLTINSDTTSGGKVVLEGNVTSTVTAGQASITNGGTDTVAGILDLNAGNRTVTVANGSGVVDMLISADITGGIGAALTKDGAGRLALDGAQDYLLLTTNGGTTDVNGAFTGGTAAIDANATTNFTVSQTIASLDIADGVVVTLGSPAPLAPFDEGAGFDAGGGELGVPASTAAVPEPASASLLLLGAIGLLGRRRRSA